MSKMVRGEHHKKLWDRLCSELLVAPLTEAYIVSADHYVDGMCEDGSITIAPHHHVVDTVIHELLHRIYPERSERSIRRTTTMLRKTLTDDEVLWFYDEYQKRKRTGEQRSTDV
jgi:hypothetical protein